MTRKKKPLLWAADALNTEYKREYPQKEGLHNRAITRKHPDPSQHKYVDSLATFDATTTTQTDFQPWDSQRRDSMKPNLTAIGHRPFNGDTTYAHHYPAKEAVHGDLKTVARMKGTAVEGAPFQGESTARTDYPDWGVQPPKTPPPRPGPGTNLKFDKTSSYQEDYAAWEVQPRAHRESAPVLPGVAGETTTSYSLDYGAKAAPQRCKVTKDRCLKELAWAPGALNTEYGREFPAKQGQFNGIASRKAKKAGAIGPGAPLDDQSTMKADYPAWGGSGRRASMKPEAKLLADRYFDDDTTYKAQFLPKAGVHSDNTHSVHAMKTATVRSALPFNAESTHHADFHDWGPGAAVHTHAKHQHSLPKDVPFLGTTTYRQDYTGKDAPMVALRRSLGVLPGVHLQNGTTYAGDYTPKPLDHATLHGICRDRPWSACESCNICIRK